MTGRQPPDERSRLEEGVEIAYAFGEGDSEAARLALVAELFE